jgi:riboflavin kinase/FMN adenylyltransferase
MLRIHRLPTAVPAEVRGSSLALGNFDGVHAGHQEVLDAAMERGLPLAAAVFEPHPRRFFQPDAPPFRLQTNAQRARTLATWGVRDLFEIPFDHALSQLSDRAFVQSVLRDQIGVRNVSVGEDFRFGKGRVGDAESLRRLGAEFGFGVVTVSAVKREGVRTSSTAIRDAIARGAMEEAAALLTRPWAIEGVVQKGFQRGREFGFATANIALGEYVRPRLGIYTVRVDLGDGALRAGVASVGVNPTVGALPEPLLEAHLFDFDADLYGRKIEVQMVAYLRDEAHFESVDALKAQMAVDAARARAILG